MFILTHRNYIKVLLCLTQPTVLLFMINRIDTVYRGIDSNAPGITPNRKGIFFIFHYLLFYWANCNRMSAVIFRL